MTHHLYKTLRHSIELYYDLQQARIAYGHRALDPNETEQLSPEDKAFQATLGEKADELERTVLKHAAKKLKGHPVYDWLTSQRGIADTFAVILMGFIDIEKTETVSGLWRLAGLAVGKDGKRERPMKGEKLHYNPHLKTRMYLLGESFIKARNEHYRAYYDDYKARKQAEIVVCMLCDGTGLYTASKEKKSAAEASEEKTEKKTKKPKVCERCNGTKEAPWGRSDKHLHVASMRYMVKQFLADFYEVWRTHEGLPTRPMYSAEHHERMKQAHRAQQNTLLAGKVRERRSA